METPSEPEAQTNGDDEGHNDNDLTHGLPTISLKHANRLRRVVHHSSVHHDVTATIHRRIVALERVLWFWKLTPGLERGAARFHWGNFVAVRGTDERVFESMPIYVRIGMRLLFAGKKERSLLHFKRIQRLLQEESVKQGRIYDSPNSVHSITSFVKTYSIHTEELLNPDLGSYKCFNEFFHRKLKAGVRPVEKIDDPTYFCCCADSRLVVHKTVDLAKEFWVKGAKFNIPNLLNVPPDSARAAMFDGGSLAIFRLAPQDYHRFHCPLDGVVGDIEHIPGNYYTVNPMAVNEPGFDVFTENTRSILYLQHKVTRRFVAYVAIGALLVGSVGWTAGGKKGREVLRGDELGYFAYGGSTVVVIFPKDTIEFDEDLVKNSQEPIETLVKVGYSLGHLVESAIQVPTKPMRKKDTMDCRIA